MEQQIRFCTTTDGVRIAYATAGEGPPLVKAATWLTHLEFDWESPVWRHLFRALAANHTLIRYDERGTGLSDRHVDEVSLDGWVLDLEAVVDALDLKEFPLLGISQGGPVAVQYTGRHPERVSRLILYGTYPGLSSQKREDLPPDTIARARVLHGAIQSGWGQDNPAFRQLFTTMFIPDATREQMQWFNELQRVSASPEMAAKIQLAIWQADVSDILPTLRTPALVMHCKNDSTILFEAGRELAALMPNARFVPLEGNNHLLLEGEPAFEHFLDLVGEFLGDEPLATAAPRAPSGVHTILFTDIVSSTALTQRLGDAKMQELVRVHDSIVGDALRSNGGHEIKHTGDGIMASFGTGSAALECAIAIARAIALRQAQGGDMKSLAVHVGLNAGEPVAESDDLFGASVQLARRLCDHSASGQIVVADVVRQLALGKGFTFAPLPEAKLKGFDEPVRAYELVWREESPSGPDGLTAREVEVLRLIAAGRTNTEIASELTLSVRTVARHITNIYTKIGARNKVEATDYVHRNKLT